MLRNFTQNGFELFWVKMGGGEGGEDQGEATQVIYSAPVRRGRDSTGTARQKTS